MEPGDVRHLMFKHLNRLRLPYTNIVQVGANSGQEVDAFQHYRLEWAVMIEPLSAPFRKLGNKVADLPNYIPVQALCSSMEGIEYDFHVASNKGQSSSLLEPARHLATYPQIEFPNSVKLVSTTVDAVMNRVLQDHPGLSLAQFDCMMIDVQGAELKVLMGATALLQHTRYIWTEVSYDLYEGGATLEQLQAFLQAFGFRLHCLELNRQAWGDALFVKTAG